jgi:hypothetical protein
MKVKARVTCVGSKAEAFKAEALTGSVRPPRDQGRSLYSVDGLLAGQRLRPMKQRRLRQRKTEMPLVVYACI